jgi:hypothetical protein
MTPDEAIVVQAETLRSHLPPELQPPLDEFGEARILSDGLLRLIHGDRWYVLAKGGTVAWTWLATGPGQGAIEVVEYFHGIEVDRDLIPIEQLPE